MFIGILFLVVAFLSLGVFYFGRHKLTSFGATMLLIKVVGLVGFSIGSFTDNSLLSIVSLIVFATSIALFWGDYISNTDFTNKKN